MTEFDEDLDALVVALESREPEWADFCWPKERVAVDTYNTIGFLENGGLYAFWSGDIRQGRIIRNFRRIGADRLATIFQESRWARNLIRYGDYDDRRSEFGEERFDRFSKLEDEMFDEFENAFTQLKKFVVVHKIEARPFGLIGKICASVYGISQWGAFLVREFVESAREAAYTPPRSVNKN